MIVTIIPTWDEFIQGESSTTHLAHHDLPTFIKKPVFTKSHHWFRKTSAKLTSNFIFLQAINYMIVAFCAYSGEISFLGILGDYTKYALHFSGEVYTTG